MPRSLYFNPRSPHGERRIALLYSHQRKPHFNPRSPHGERRHNDGRQPESHTAFQSTLPARGATRRKRRRGRQFFHFNPRSPHGERLRMPAERCWIKNFNPRSPHGERLVLNAPLLRRLISIHAPRTGSDQTLDKFRVVAQKFQSTLPARGATIYLQLSVSAYTFQSTLPARGATAES